MIKYLIFKSDHTYIYIDEQGAKISRFRENCIDLHGKYYYDVELMKRIARKIRTFHDAGYDLPDSEKNYYDPMWQTERLFKEASRIKGDLFKVFEKEWIMIRKLQKYADMDGVEHTMCHNDINAENVLLTENTLDIVDYEFAGYTDEDGNIFKDLNMKTMTRGFLLFWRLISAEQQQQWSIDIGWHIALFTTGTI